ncbi:MAG TPA: signal peptidase II [Gemmatimonadales bacterium]|nr:signal peptidase II [Gemmatimonadales bacterium]
MASAADRRLFWGTVLGVVGLDLVTKFAAEAVLVHRPIPVIGDYVILRLVYNQCAAFGVCLGPALYSRWIFLALAIVALVVLGSMVRATKDGEQFRFFVLGLLCAGAVGNVVDRLRSSQGVVDFIEVGIGRYRWPTFNVADSAITVGAIALAIALWAESHEPQEGHPKEAGAAS